MKKYIIDTFEKWSNNSKISNKNIGSWIRSIHFTSPFFLLFFVIFGPRWIANIGITILIIIISSFIYFRCCLLSLLEKRICNDDINIVDAWLEMFGFKIFYHNKHKLNKQRYLGTFIIGIIYIVTILSIYYYRFMLY